MKTDSTWSAINLPDPASFSDVFTNCSEFKMSYDCWRIAAIAVAAAPSFCAALFASFGLQHTRILPLEVVPFTGEQVMCGAWHG